MRLGLARCALVAILLGICGLVSALTAAPALASDPPAISVLGNQLEAGGSAIQLRGVNRDAFASCTSSSVYDATFAGSGFDDPDDDFADGPVNQWSIDVMKSWGINSVRIPVNESCWLGQPNSGDAAPGQGVAPSECENYSPYACETAAQYRQAVENYVNLLGQNGLYVVIDLQYTAPPGYVATGEDHFPDEADTPTFWQQTAQAFSGDPFVMFDLDGEVAAGQYDGPCYDGEATCPENGYAENWSVDQIWQCWLNGCSNVPSLYSSSGGSPVDYDTAGMQQLINTVRATGATNPIVVGSPDFARGYEQQCTPPSGSGADEPCLTAYMPADPDHQMVFDVHLYDYDFLNVDGTAQAADPTAQQEQEAVSDVKAYIDDDMVPIAKNYPVMLGEVGETDCADPNAPFMPALLADLSDFVSDTGQNASLLAWTWDANTDEGSQVESGWHCPTGVDGQGGPPLITDYNGSPTPMGQVVENWLQGLDPSHPANPGAPSPGSGTTAPTGTTTTTSPTGTTTTPSGTTTTPTGSGPTTTPTGSPTTSTQASPPSTTPTSSTTATQPAGTPPGGSATAPQLRTAPHVAVSEGTLRCSGGVFSGAGGASVSYSWFASTGRRLAGPGTLSTLSAARVADRAVQCAETVSTSAGSVTGRSRLLPVPGRVGTGAAGQVRLEVICPSGSGACQVSLRLTDAGRSATRLGSARVSLAAGGRRSVTVSLSTAGRLLLRREGRLTARLTVLETIRGVRQTVALSTVTLH